MARQNAQRMSEKDMQDVGTLLRGVEYALSNPGSLNSAIWRLMDAAGIIAKNLSPEERYRLIGLADETGRGFKLAGSGVERL